MSTFFIRPYCHMSEQELNHLAWVIWLCPFDGMLILPKPILIYTVSLCLYCLGFKDSKEKLSQS